MASRLIRILWFTAVIASVMSLTFWLSNRQLTQAESLPKRPPTPTPEILPNGWYRYVDHSAGYAISYPPEVYFEISRDAFLRYPQIFLTFPRGTGGHGMFILVKDNPKGLAIDAFLRQEVYKERINSIDGYVLQRVRIGRYEWFQVKDDKFYFPLLLLFHKDKVYMQILGVDMLTLATPSPESREIFFRIASTFTLLEESERGQP
ncbi:MAG: hypothetical protein GXN93_05400 [Candidatus Diapherotrites archaeon]|nr:hypothetical protein [Candidatus Diapherotrites archaeon]